MRTYAGGTVEGRRGPTYIDVLKRVQKALVWGKTGKRVYVHEADEALGLGSMWEVSRNTYLLLASRTKDLAWESRLYLVKTRSRSRCGLHEGRRGCVNWVILLPFAFIHPGMVWWGGSTYVDGLAP